MKRFLFYICVAAALLGSGACKKALTETPYSFLSPSNFYTDSSDAVAAVNGIYSQFWSWGLMYQSYWLIDLDCDHADGASWFLGNIGAGNPAAFWGINDIWADHYTMVSRANSVLANVAGMTSISQGLKNRLMGEAYFLRGWAYFDLVRIYGQVPVHLKTIQDGDNPNMPKSTVAQVFNVVISDFRAADSLLYMPNDPRSGEVGRVNKAIAESFLSKAYITMASGSLSGASLTVQGGPDNGMHTYTKDVVAGYEGFNSASMFDSARTYALKVINMGIYTLFPNFMDVWQIASRNVGENMWEIQALAGNTSLETDLYYYFSASQPNYSGVGAVWMTDNHYNEYEHPDVRIRLGVAHQYMVNYGQALYPNWVLYPEQDTALYKTDSLGNQYTWNGTYYDRAYSMKYSYVTNPGTANSDNDIPMLRYAEVLLLYAEAENEVNGPDATAYQYLNMVRTRSAASAATPGMSQQQFRSFVFAERGRELVFESQRRYDLLRWGVYLQVMNALGVVQQGNDQITKVRSTRNLLFPISTDEIDANPSLGGNNPGW